MFLLSKGCLIKKYCQKVIFNYLIGTYGRIGSWRARRAGPVWMEEEMTTSPKAVKWGGAVLSFEDHILKAMWGKRGPNPARQMGIQTASLLGCNTFFFLISFSCTILIYLFQLFTASYTWAKCILNLVWNKGSRVLLYFLFLFL